MTRILSILFALSLAAGTLAPAAHAAVNVERNGAENPMVEVSRAVIYGGLAGAVVGGAYAFASDADNKNEIIRWSTFTGTVVGLAGGLYFVSHRERANALLEIDGGAPRLHFPPLAIGPDGTPHTTLVGVRF